MCVFCSLMFSDVFSYVKAFVGKLRSYLRSSAGTWLSEVKSSQKLSPENEEALKKVLVDVKSM